MERSLLQGQVWGASALQAHLLSLAEQQSLLPYNRILLTQPEHPDHDILQTAQLLLVPVLCTIK